MELIDELHKIHDPAPSREQPNVIFDPLILLASVQKWQLYNEI